VTTHRLWRAALISVALVGLGIGGWMIAVRPDDPAPRPGHAALRMELLRELRDRMVPSAGGGWVVATPADPVIENWLSAAAVSPNGADSFDRALDEAQGRAAGDADSRSLDLVLATVLPGPTDEPERADRLAADILERSTAKLDRGDASGLGPLLQLSAGSTRQASAAQQDLRRRAGPVGCDRLDLGSGALPAPGTSLTVALRVLASGEVRCEQAVDVLSAALDHPAWSGWVATSELTDLAQIVPSMPPSLLERLARRFDGFLSVDATQPIDLGAAVAVERARAELGLEAELRGPLARHVAGQVRSRGGLPGRSASAPTLFDVAILRQLVGADLVPAPALDSSAEAMEWPEVSGALDPIVERVLVRDEPMTCRSDLGRSPPRARVSFDGLVAEEARAIVPRACADRLDLPRRLRQLSSSRPADQAAVRIASALLAACRLDPDLIGAAPAFELEVDGPFATDPIVIWARSIAADPSASCAAVR
jgi:hypothetical protein